MLVTIPLLTLRSLTQSIGRHAAFEQGNLGLLHPYDKSVIHLTWTLTALTI